MPTPTEALAARVVALLSGEYPPAPATPHIPPGLFRPGKVMLPAENPRHPTGALRKASANRKWDFVWQGASWDGASIEGSTGGPYVRRLPFVFTVQYEIEQPPRQAPTDARLVLGALNVASGRAVSDLLEVQRIFMLDEVWEGVAVAYVPIADAITTLARDGVAMAGTLRGVFLIEQSGVNAGEFWEA